MSPNRTPARRPGNLKRVDLKRPDCPTSKGEERYDHVDRKKRRIRKRETGAYGRQAKREKGDTLGIKMDESNYSAVLKAMRSDLFDVAVAAVRL